MVFRRCPQCGSTSDDIYGFCIKCGYEFPQMERVAQTCPLCGYENPDEADYCVKCGTPLFFKEQLQNNSVINPVVVKKEYSTGAAISRRMKILIVFGYIFSILGGLLGLIIAIYLATRKDAYCKRHGRIQLAIFAFYIVLIAVFYATGAISPDVISQYRQVLAGNFSSL